MSTPEPGGVTGGRPSTTRGLQDVFREARTLLDGQWIKGKYHQKDPAGGHLYCLLGAVGQVVAHDPEVWTETGWRDDPVLMGALTEITEALYEPEPCLEAVPDDDLKEDG